MSNALIISILIAYFAVLILIMRVTSKNANNESFFLGERKSPWFIVAFGMIGASLSGVTFISVPGGVGKGGFGYMQVVLGYFIGYIIVAKILIPLFYKQNLTSIYEYLKTRFGNYSYRTGALFFLVSRVIGASIRLLLVAQALQLILLDNLNVPFEISVIISVGLIWLYTNKGGIKTIIWTDTLQTAFMLLALLFTTIMLMNNIEFSEAGIWHDLSNFNKNGLNTIFNFGDFNSGGYFWKSFIGGCFITIGMTGLDQDMMQKNLTCKNHKESQKNMLTMASILVIVNFAFLFMGALMFLYSSQTGIGNNAITSGKTDMLFAEIAQNDSTPILIGVFFLLGLIAAAYSSADSALTSLTTSFSVDILDIKQKEEREQESLRKSVHIGMSILLILVVIILNATMETSAIWTLIKAAGFTYGPLIGLFFFGILTKRKLNDQWVPFIATGSAIIMLFVWFLSKGGLLIEKDAPGIFGNYAFGADLIVWNSLLSFVLFYASSIISKEKA